MSKRYNGHCACGAVTYGFDTPPSFVANCHCTDCKRASGGEMATFGLVSESDFTVFGGEVRSFPYGPNTETCAGNGLDRVFCTTCGSRVFTNNLKDYPAASSCRRARWTSSTSGFRRRPRSSRGAASRSCRPSTSRSTTTHRAEPGAERPLIPRLPRDQGPFSSLWQVVCPTQSKVCDASSRFTLSSPGFTPGRVTDPHHREPPFPTINATISQAHGWIEPRSTDTDPAIGARLFRQSGSDSYRAIGDRQAALKALEHAVELAEQDEWLRFFLDAPGPTEPIRRLS